MAEQKIKAREFKGGPGRRARGPRPKLKHPGKTLAAVMRYIMRSYAPHIVLVVICIFISVLASVQGTLFMKTLIDSYILPMLAQVRAGQAADFTALAHAIGRVAAFYLCGAAAGFLQTRVMIYVTQGTLRGLRSELFTHMETLSIGFFDTHPHGDIMSVYTNDIDTLRQMISMSLPQLLNCSVTIVSVFLSMLFLSVPLTCLTVAVIALMMFLTKKFTGISGQHFVAQQRDIGHLNAFIEEMMEGQKVVKVFCREQASVEEFTRRNESLFHSADNANAFSNMLGPICAQLGNVGYVLCAVAGGALALNGVGGFTLGGLASFLTFNKSINMPISQISMQFNSVIMGLAGAERVFALLAEQPEEDGGKVTLVFAEEKDGVLTETQTRTEKWAWKSVRPDGTAEYRPLDGGVVFEHVDFGYVPEKTVLHGINLYAEPGQKIAFVGSTGAGKTTITNLINRFYDIQQGSILYDGIPVRDIRKADLRHSLGIVLQDTHLFTGSVRDNIRYGRLDATDAEVEAAARLANADGFISRLPQGYDTVLHGDGANLSQGQRQLLAIARAAIADPPVLILDEATSSIDTRTEKLVQEGMDRLMAGRTTFVIAHRLSTVRNSDCIMVMEQGEIIERGTHESLLAKQGRYYQLYTGNTGSPA